MNEPALPQWKVDVVKEAIRLIQREPGCLATVEKVCTKVPFLSSLDIQLAMTNLKMRRDLP
jgi:hypothetical protein